MLALHVPCPQELLLLRQVSLDISENNFKTLVLQKKAYSTRNYLPESKQHGNSKDVQAEGYQRQISWHLRQFAVPVKNYLNLYLI